MQITKYENFKNQCNLLSMENEIRFISFVKREQNFGWGVQAFHAYSNSVHSRRVTDLFKKNLDVRIHSINKSADNREIL